MNRNAQRFNYLKLQIWGGFHSVVLLILTISSVELPDCLFFFFSFFFGQRFMNWGTVLNTQDLRPAMEAKAWKLLCK